MKDESALVRIWLGTKDIPSDSIWVKKVLTPESLIFHVKERFKVDMKNTWFDGGVLRLKGGEEFIIDTENGLLYEESRITSSPPPDLSESYLRTREVSETQDSPDEQAETALGSEVIQDEEYRRYVINGSDGYWKDTVCIPLSKPMQDLKLILSEVRQRLKVPNPLFALVKDQKYLPRRGWLSQPISEVEAKLRGESKEQWEIDTKKEFLRDPKFPTSFRLRCGKKAPMIWPPSTVAEIRETAIQEDWFKDDGYRSEYIEVGRMIDGRWRELNDCQKIYGGEVIVRQSIPASCRQSVTCIVPMQEEIEEEDQYEEDSDDDDDSENEEEDDEPKREREASANRHVRNSDGRGRWLHDLEEIQRRI
jgi:hypothetical protein